MFDRMTPKVGAASGFLYVVLLLVSAENESRAGLVVGAIAMALFLPFIAYLWGVLRDAEGGTGWLSTTALAAGVAALANKLGGLAPEYVARGMDEGPLREALVQMGDFTFITTMLPLGVFMGGVAAVVLKTRVLPLWLGALAALAAPLLLVNGTFFDAEFGPAFLLYLLWVLLAGVFLALPGSTRAE